MPELGREKKLAQGQGGRERELELGKRRELLDTQLKLFSITIVIGTLQSKYLVPDKEPGTG